MQTLPYENVTADIDKKKTNSIANREISRMKTYYNMGSRFVLKFSKLTLLEIHVISNENLDFELEAV